MPVSANVPNVLSIAGTDPTGGAGVQADLKSFSVFGAYGMAVVTALVAQNTQGVREIHAPPREFLRAQLDSVSDDVRIDAVKVGMLGTVEIIEEVTNWWRSTFSEQNRPLLVVDPVMVATSGDRLLEEQAEAALKEFLHFADLITPNVPELALIAGTESASSSAELLEQAQQVADEHGVLVLAKGGHLRGDQMVDTLIAPTGAVGDWPQQVTGPRIETTNTHGTGCSVSAAFAALAAGGTEWGQALKAVKEWMNAALEGADSLEVGQGNGPIHHFAELSLRNG